MIAFYCTVKRTDQPYCTMIAFYCTVRLTDQPVVDLDEGHVRQSTKEGNAPLPP